MTLRRRRRISPRTKRRYRAIQNFFRRTLGTIASQPDIKINSSIAVNVTDLKQKIIGIEHQLDEVGKNYRDIVSFENISRKEIEGLIPTEGNSISSSSRICKDCSDKKVTEKDTQLLYKTSESRFGKAENSEIIYNLYNEPRDNDRISSETMNLGEYNTISTPIRKSKSKKSKRDIYYENFDVSHANLRNRTRPENGNSAVFADSYPSLSMPKPGQHAAPARSARRHGRQQSWLEEHTTCPTQEDVKVKTHKDTANRRKSESPSRRQEKRHGKSKKSNIQEIVDELDEDFIADLIQRQYRPVKYFDRSSDASLISFPVCRDREFAARENVTNGSESCSCCQSARAPARRRRARGGELPDMRSLCDTRLYSARHRARSRPRHQQPRAYNDSDLYDVVPVKEKSSPNSRRKFVEDNMHYEYEVPPSPRSHRPRLNLRAQNYDSCEGSTQSHRKRSPYQQRRPECLDRFRSELSSEETAQIRNTKIKPKSTKNAEIQEDMGTVSSLQYPAVGAVNRNTTYDTSNKADYNIDKTDKALSEIKDILQNFLQEIKKESDKSNETIGKTKEKCFEDCQQESVTSPRVLQSNGHNQFSGYGLAPCGAPAVAPRLPGSCCCRVMPVCPVNCMQNGYLLASPSYTCPACVNTHNSSDIRHDGSIPKGSNTCEATTSKINTDTDNLIREIYNYVAQKPNIKTKESSENIAKRDSDKNTELPSKGVGKNTFPSRHDAGVCTLPTRCYSKSCEALGARAPAHPRSRTNTSYSDTVLEKFSSDATTQSISTYDTINSSALEKGKKSKFSTVLQSFGLLKRNKKHRKDAIEEVSETESSTEVDAKARERHPFGQDLTNYMMHAQEFYHPPPVPPPHRARRSSPPHGHTYPSYDPNDMYDPYRTHIHAHASAPPYSRIRQQASAPPYPCPYERCSHNLQPQVPLCLKEIEVQSTGTQSERRMPFFRKFAQRRPVPASASQPARGTALKNYGTQTAQTKPGLWKELQTNAASKKFPDFAFSMKEQKKLAEGDSKMRNVLLKKLFYKRNPFSPRNLIVRTLLGNDRSSWGVPPAGMVKRPRLFL